LKTRQIINYKTKNEAKCRTLTNCQGSFLNKLDNSKKALEKAKN
jgi:hypothetical protein